MTYFTGEGLLEAWVPTDLVAHFFSFRSRRIAMTCISRTQRVVLLTAMTALVSGGGLLSSSAFAAPATSHSAPAMTVMSHSDRGGGDWHDRSGDGDWRSRSDRGDGDWHKDKGKNEKRGGKTVTKTKEVEIRPDGTRIFRQTTKVEITKGFHKSSDEFQGLFNGRQ
jgi:hypothetical protein